MKPLKTKRLLLRKYKADDFVSVHSYASILENVVYMPFEPNSEEDTRAFINFAITKADENPLTHYQYAAVLKDSDMLIGGCNLTLSGHEAEIGWRLHHNYWNKGYGAEIGEALLEFAFGELNLHRITAHCDAENISSYKVMEKIGMRQDGLFIEARPPHKLSNRKYGDELSYAILQSEWETRKEIAYYNLLPYIFDDFIEVPELSDGVIYLVCTDKTPCSPEKKWVPTYNFIICKNGEKIGALRLSIGYTEGLYYGGQIGYGIDEKHRGKGYATRACRLLTPVIKAHGMGKVIITNDHNNSASKRICEKLEARFIRTARLPEWHDMYERGLRFVNIFEWDV